MNEEHLLASKLSLSSGEISMEVSVKVSWHVTWKFEGFCEAREMGLRKEVKKDGLR